MKQKIYRHSKKKKKIAVLPILFTALISLMVFYVWIFNYTNILYQEVDLQKRERDSMRIKNKTIEVEIEKLSRSDRIKQIACEKLDMVVPEPETLEVVIDPHQSRIQ
jgi:cell division protein FtsL